MAEKRMTPKEVATFWFKKSAELEEKVKELETTNYNLLQEKQKLEQNAHYWLEAWYRELKKTLSVSMTYEQIVDLKCENKRLTEQLAKFEKWQRLLDKIKIF